MTTTRWLFIISLIVAACLLSGCAEKEPTYGREYKLEMPGNQTRVWAVAPVLNLSGQPVDPLIQADVLYQQMQTVSGLTVVPIDRVMQVMVSVNIESIQSADQAVIIMDLLGCDGLVVGTITQYDPYNPPKFAGSLQLFQKPGGFQRTPAPDPRDLVRSAAPKAGESLPQQPSDIIQSVGMYDSSSGSVRDAVLQYAIGRHEPAGPMGAQEYFLSMDRYSGFAWHSLLEDLLVRMRNGR